MPNDPIADLATRIDRDAELTHWWVSCRRHDLRAGKCGGPQATWSALDLMFRIEAGRRRIDLTAAQTYIEWCRTTAQSLRHNTSEDPSEVEARWRAAATRSDIRTIRAVDVLTVVAVIGFSYGLVTIMTGLTPITAVLMLCGSAALIVYLKTAAPQLAVGPDAPRLWWARWQHLLADLPAPEQHSR